MPNKAAAKKALRQTVKRTALNLKAKTAYKEAVKTAKKTIDAGNDAKDAIQHAQKLLDKAAKRGVIKKNTASRKLSRLAQIVGKGQRIAGK